MKKYIVFFVCLSLCASEKDKTKHLQIVAAFMSNVTFGLENRGVLLGDQETDTSDKGSKDLLSAKILNPESVFDGFNFVPGIGLVKHPHNSLFYFVLAMEEGSLKSPESLLFSRSCFSYAKISDLN